eukprot:TRINITY_DN69_c0_g1_i13.p1 TRINITY_DN69_c0_g1~~TRINITY_DN69_c0_g1_i13.p1  ORF type:complete len:988 (+),score=150.58 TRINITY_DN69_c0_g1_i13:804-3767(+)
MTDWVKELNTLLQGWDTSTRGAPPTEDEIKTWARLLLDEGYNLASLKGEAGEKRMRTCGMKGGVIEHIQHNLTGASSNNAGNNTEPLINEQVLRNIIGLTTGIQDTFIFQSQIISSMSRQINDIKGDHKGGGFKCAIYGLRRSGKTTLLQLFILQLIDFLAKNKIFVFWFDCARDFVDGEWSYGFEGWVNKFFKILSVHYPENKTQIDTRKNEILGELRKQEFPPNGEPAVYKKWINWVESEASAWGFKQTIYVLDEFEGTFSQWSVNKTPLLISFNVIIKKHIESTNIGQHFLLAGTDALQIAFSLVNGDPEHDDTSLIMRSLQHNNMITAGVISYDDYRRYKEQYQLPSFPIIFGGVSTVWEDYGGVPSFIAKLRELNTLYILMTSGIQQDVYNLRRILHYKPHLLKKCSGGTSNNSNNSNNNSNNNNNQDANNKNIVDEESIAVYIRNVKLDMLCLLSGVKPEYLDTRVLDYTGFFKNGRLSVPFIAIVYNMYMEDLHSYPPGLLVLLETERNCSVLGWKMQEAIGANLRKLIEENQRPTRLTVTYLQGDNLPKTEVLLPTSSFVGMDYSALQTAQFKTGTLCFDLGCPDTKREKQQHLPAIDFSITGDLSDIKEEMRQQFEGDLPFNIIENDNDQQNALGVSASSVDNKDNDVDTHLRRSKRIKTKEAGHQMIQDDVGGDSICRSQLKNLKYKTSHQQVFQVKSTIQLKKESIDNTICKYFSLRVEGNVCGQILKKMYGWTESAQNNLRFYFKIRDAKAKEYYWNVTGSDTKQLLETIKGGDFMGAYYTYTGDDVLVLGEVSIFMIIAGSFDSDFLSQYAGVKFVWGPKQLEPFFGMYAMERILRNRRFRIISIFPDEDKTYDLTKVDDSFVKKILIEVTAEELKGSPKKKGEKKREKGKDKMEGEGEEEEEDEGVAGEGVAKEEVIYVLNQTEEEDVQRYLARRYGLPSLEFVSIHSEQGGYRTRRKRKREEETEQGEEEEK